MSLFLYAFAIFLELSASLVIACRWSAFGYVFRLLALVALLGFAGGFITSIAYLFTIHPISECVFGRKLIYVFHYIGFSAFDIYQVCRHLRFCVFCV